MSSSGEARRASILVIATSSIRKLLLAAAAALVIAAAPAWAEVTTEEQKVLAAKSKLSVAAFKCSWLADRASYNEEHSRLFLLGYGAGIEFLVVCFLIPNRTLATGALNDLIWSKAAIRPGSAQRPEPTQSRHSSMPPRTSVLGSGGRH